MTKKEKIKFLKLLHSHKTLSRKQLCLTFGERTDYVIRGLMNKGYIILCNPTNVKGVIQKSDNDIFRLSDVAVDYIEDVIEKRKEKLYTWLWRAIPIAISLYSLYKSSNKPF